MIESSSPPSRPPRSPEPDPPEPRVRRRPSRDRSAAADEAVPRPTSRRHGRPDHRKAVAVPYSGRGRALSLKPTYFIVTVLMATGVTIVAPSEEVATFVSLGIVWAIVSVLLRPGWQTASHGAVVMLTLTLLARNYSQLEPAAIAWGLLALAIMAVPFVVRPLKTLDGFPFLHMYCLIQGIYIYVSIFFSVPPPQYRWVYTPEIRTAGFRTLCLFLAVLVSGAAIAGVCLRRVRGRRQLAVGVDGRRGETSGVLPPERNPVVIEGAVVGRAYMLLIVANLVLAAATVTRVYDSLGTLGFLIKLVAFGGWLVFVLGWLRGSLRLWHKPVVLVMPALWVLVTVGDTLLYQAALPGFLILALWMADRRKIPWLAIFGALAVLIVLNVGKGQLRQDVKAGYVEGSGTELSATWLQAAGDTLAEGEADSLEVAAWRFSNSDVLGYIDTWVPDRYPYYGYEPYTSLPTILIPRVLAPDKPTFGFANEFGRRYELLQRYDTITSLNTPLPVEALVIGGYLPMVVVALIVGAYFRVLQRVFRTKGIPTLVTGSLLCLQVVSSVESGILQMLLMPGYALVLYPLIWWVANGMRPLRHVASSAASDPDPVAAAVRTSASARARHARRI